jgi:hypothetical protein
VIFVTRRSETLTTPLVCDVESRLGRLHLLLQRGLRALSLGRLPGVARASQPGGSRGQEGTQTTPRKPPRRGQEDAQGIQDGLPPTARALPAAVRTGCSLAHEGESVIKC